MNNFHARRQTRLWICEKGDESEFVMLKDRTEELWFSYGIDDDKTYVMGIEICGEDGVWPTGLCQNNSLHSTTFYQFHISTFRRLSKIY